MSRMRLPCLIVQHLLGVTVIGTDEKHSVHLLHCFRSRPHTLVYPLDRLDRSLKHTCMSHHIRVCEVDDDDIILTGCDGSVQLL